MPRPIPLGMAAGEIKPSRKLSLKIPAPLACFWLGQWEVAD